jgi:hypothetical protein
MGGRAEGACMTDEPSKRLAAYYRQRAAEARVLATRMSDYEARETMLRAAAMWEAMAASEERHSPSN